MRQSGLSESMWAGRRSGARETTIGETLREAARRHGSREALVFIDRSGVRTTAWTYDELHERSERVARALVTHFDPGERVAIWAPNSPEWLVVEFAAALAGLTLVTVNPRYGADELRHVLVGSDARGLFFGDQPDAAATVVRATADAPMREVISLGALDELAASAPRGARLPDVHPDDPAQIQHTSGTTGLPKAVLLEHGSLVARARIGLELAGLRETDRMLNPMPMFHTSGCNWMALGSVLSGASHILLPGFEPRPVLAAIAAERATTLVGFATMLQAVVEQPDIESYGISTLRYVVSGGTSVPTALVRRIEERLGGRFSLLYGMTECSGVITQTAVEDDIEKVGTTVGRPFPETDLKIIDPDSGRTLPVGEIGELCVRGRLVMRCYLGKPTSTDADGWFHTGDFGSIDSDGYVSVEGRRYDLIVRDGRFVSPRPIEERLASHPAVAEVVVVGVPDARGGGFVATVRPCPGASPSSDELVRFLAPLAGEKPLRWRFVDHLPLTGTGKVHRYMVQEELVSTVEEAR